MIDCNTMRQTVLVAGGLLSGGTGLGFLAMNVPALALLGPLALLLVLASGLVLAGMFCAALWPGVARRLEECQH